MEKKHGNFSMEDAMRMADSPAGQQLVAMLKSADPNRLQEAVNLAGNGDYRQAGKVLQTLLSAPEARTLLRQLEDS